MRARLLLLALLFPGALLADGMVGVPDAQAERAAIEPPAVRRHIVIEGGGGPQRRLVDYEAHLARERADAEARRRAIEQEMAAVLAYRRGSADQAARAAKDAADLASLRRQRDLELDSAADFAFACHHYDPKVGCRGAPLAARP
jgi:hypothetical protein